MRTISAALAGIATVVLAACGSSTPSSVPAAGVPQAGHDRSVDGSTVAYQNAHLYVLSDTMLREFPARTNSDGAQALRAVHLEGSITTMTDLAIAPDGTVYVAGTNTARQGVLYAYAPGKAVPEVTMVLPAPPCSIALVGDAFDVATQTAIYSYPYGSGTHPAAIRTLTLPSVSGPLSSECATSTDNDDHLYVARGIDRNQQDEILEFAAGAKGGAIPIRTFTAPHGIVAVSVAVDGTVYSAGGDPADTPKNVTVATTTASAGRLAAAYCSPTAISAMTVDRSGDVYVGVSIPSFFTQNGYTDPRRVDVFAPTSVATIGSSCTTAVGQSPANAVWHVTNAVGTGEVVRAVAIGP